MFQPCRPLFSKGPVRGVLRLHRTLLKPPSHLRSVTGCRDWCRKRGPNTLPASASVVEPEVVESLSTQDPEIVDRKSAILLDILTAGGQVEQKLSQHASEVDGVMLRLLERRIETAKRCDEEPKHIEGLHILYKRLRLMLDRQAANPVELLLDDLLTRMAEPDWTSSDEQRQEIMECMRAAFGLPEPEVNIFGLAADLSYGSNPAEADSTITDSSPPPDDLPNVSMPEFSQQSRELLKGVLRDCIELRKALESRQYLDSTALLEQKLCERVVLAQQVEDLIRIADHVTMGLASLAPNVSVGADDLSAMPEE